MKVLISAGYILNITRNKGMLLHTSKHIAWGRPFRVVCARCQGTDGRNKFVPVVVQITPPPPNYDKWQSPLNISFRKYYYNHTEPISCTYFSRVHYHRNYNHFRFRWDERLLLYILSFNSVVFSPFCTATHLKNAVRICIILKYEYLNLMTQKYVPVNEPIWLLKVFCCSNMRMGYL